MDFSKLYRWLVNHVSVKNRLERICAWYLLFLMVKTKKKSLHEAGLFTNIAKSLFGRFLQLYPELAAYNLKNLSKKQAKQFSKVLQQAAKLPWKILIIIDATIQERSSSLHPENVKKFNHGHGFVIGHQWTNILLVINGFIIPLPPIPYYSKSYCKENNMEYKSEHVLVIEYINSLSLEDYVGSYNSKDVLVLADSGYDDNEIESAIDRKNWTFIIALKKSRSVKTIKQYGNTPKSKDWTRVDDFFRNNRWLAWITIRLLTNGPKKKRIVFRIRQTKVFLRNVGEVLLICSEMRNRPDGRRKYIACNDLKIPARQILMGYKLRWLIEIFHKEVKMHLGFQDVSTTSFESVKAHVHWVYCAYILLNFNPPGIPKDVTGVAEKQKIVKNIIDSKEKKRILQLLTQIGGVEKYKSELRTVLQGI